MRLAFIGYTGSFKYDKIGGSDAIVRRLSNHLKGEYEIYLLSYGNDIESNNNIDKNIHEINFITFKDMLTFIKNNDIENSISIYLKPLDRVKLYFFGKKYKRLFFHALISNFNEKVLKRWLLFWGSSITFNGNIYCISKRIYNQVKQISSKAILLLPPVDDSFFNNMSQDIKQNKKIRISYMGRLDYGKGADLAYQYFLNSKLDREKYEFYIYAYPWENDMFSMKLHQTLKLQNDITYVETKLFNNQKEVDEFLAKVIDGTDIFFLPYRFMISTIDAPLVPMEIMARNKLFISTNIDGIKDIAYDKEVLIERNELNNYEMIDMKVETQLNSKQSIQDFVNKLNYKTSSISEIFLNTLKR